MFHLIYIYYVLNLHSSYRVLFRDILPLLWFELHLWRLVVPGHEDKAASLSDWCKVKDIFYQLFG